MDEIENLNEEKEAADFRKEVARMRCTKDEKDRLKKRAENYKMTVSDFMRLRCLGQRSVVLWPLPDELAAIRTELNRIGNNLNQLTKVINETKKARTLTRDDHAKIFDMVQKTGKQIKYVDESIRERFAKVKTTEN